MQASKGSQYRSRTMRISLLSSKLVRGDRQIGGRPWSTSPAILGATTLLGDGARGGPREYAMKAARNVDTNRQLLPAAFRATTMCKASFPAHPQEQSAALISISFPMSGCGCEASSSSNCPSRAVHGMLSTGSHDTHS